MSIKLIREDCFYYLPKFEDDSVKSIITDPPYDLSEEEMFEFLKQAFRISKEWIILFCIPENQWPLPPEQYGFWIKPISTKNTSRRYSRFVEMILFYGTGTWNSERHWSQYTNVFHDLVDSKEHPHAKPVSLMTRLIKNHSNECDLILDPFMGSGTTGYSCLLNGRNFIGIEKDPFMYSVASKRINYLRRGTPYHKDGV